LKNLEAEREREGERRRGLSFSVLLFLLLSSSLSSLLTVDRVLDRLRHFRDLLRDRVVLPVRGHEGVDLLRLFFFGGFQFIFF